MGSGAKWCEQAAASLRRARTASVFALALAAALAAGVVAFRLTGRVPAALAAALAGGLLAGLGALFQLRRRPLGPGEVAEHLNRTIPAVEESALLLLADPATLSLLERLQLHRVSAALAQAPPPGRHLPDARRGALLRGAAGCTLAAILIALMPGLTGSPTAPAPPAGALARDSVLPGGGGPAVTSVAVVVEPPSYTGRPRRQADDWDLEVEEGATIRWALTTTGGAAAGHLVTTAGDTIPLRRQGDDRFEVVWMATRSTLYRVLLETADGSVSGDLDHRLVVVPDLAPVLTIVSPDRRTEIRPGDPLLLPVQALANDDHGVDSVAIVATVTKGQGEGVKFREQRLGLGSRERREAGGLLLRQALDLAALGLESGDELYFHLEATDRRTPRPNVSRSETVFVTMVDSTRELLGLGAGVTLDLPPDFFRSQRQLIIDTERLLADQPTLPRDVFRGRSNDLGLDQGLLRLRYGQFMGDEYEGELVASGREEHGAAAGEDPPAPPVVDRITGVAIVDPLAELLHDHDDPENATLLAPQIKTKLREAISQMWSAELQLRIAEPRKSLPFQQRALELLQEIRQDARSYVRRVGFDPPPLEPDRRRLTGDLSRVRVWNPSSTTPLSLPHPALRAGLAVVQRLRGGGAIAPGDRALLELAGQELGRLAVDDPARLLDPLRALRAGITSLEPGSPPCHACLATAEQGIWRALPDAASLATRPRSPASTLMERYYRLLDRR